MSDKTNKTVRIGFLSRIDYGSDGFRQGLLELAAETFKNDNVAFVVLAGGLVSGRAVTTKTNKLNKELRAESKKLKALQMAAKPSKKKTPTELKAALKKLAEQGPAITKLIASLKDQLSALTSENMAEELAERLPHFTDAKGKPIKLYIVPSTPYDKDIGITTADLVAKKRGNDEFRVLSVDGDRLPLWEKSPHMKILEVLTPDKQAWLRGDYDSTAVQRRLKDKRRQSSSRRRPDIQVVGGVGVSLLKPEGQWPQGFMAVPACHRIEETTTAERHVGVQVMEVQCDRRNVTMRSYSFRDLLSKERHFIGVPADLSAARQTCIDLLKAEGKQTTGSFCDATKLSREEVLKTLSGIMASPDHKRRKTWPGLVYDELADRWDFDLEWVKMNLRYPQPTGERKVDNVVCICCMHAGSLDTDYKHFLTDVPKVMLETGATMLVSAGDHVEGTSHDLLLKGEIYLGLDNTKQEMLAAFMIAFVLYTVFKARFEAELKEAGAKGLSSEEIRALVDKMLPMFRYVPGNHCGWIHKAGVHPLKTMIHEIVRTLTLQVGSLLASKGQRVDDLLSLVEAHIETVGDGKFTMTVSGLPMGMTHPHMGGSKTISSSAQQALDMYRDCPVVVIGNFHTGVVVEEWDPLLGQRICVQVGTMKHNSPFESSKLKSGLDQGFAWMRIESVEGRIVSTVTTFYSNDKAKPGEKRLDGDKPFRDWLKELGIAS